MRNDPFYVILSLRVSSGNADEEAEKAFPKAGLMTGAWHLYSASNDTGKVHRQNRYQPDEEVPGTYDPQRFGEQSIEVARRFTFGLKERILRDGA